ncbi:MAG TPA: universal stress protein [Gemmatimonadaceae bacterium]
MAGSVNARFDSILIAVDFNEPSLKAARWVSRAFPDSRKSLVAVVEPPPAAPSLSHRFPSDDKLVEAARSDSEKKLEHLEREIGGSSGEVRIGRPHEQLLQAARDQSADLIVVGRQDIGTSGFARVGAIAQRLLRTSGKPILVVAGDARSPLKKILAAVDESPMTSRVLDLAGALGSEFSADVTAIHVLTSSRSESEVNETRSWLEQRIGESNIQPRVIAGARRAAESIIAEARSDPSDLIVIGSHGAGTELGAAFGSVAESVVVSAACPVLVVMKDTAET